MAVTEILLSIILAAVAAFIYIAHRNLTYWQRKGIPHDSPHWIHGNLNGVTKTMSFAEAFTKVYRRHLGSGPFCGLYFLQKPTVLVLTPELTKQVLIKDFNNFSERGLYVNEKDDPITGHLFLLQSQKWRVMRNKLTPTFTSGQMKFMFPTVVSVAEQFVETLNGDIKKSNVIEIKDLLARFTTDVIGSCAFGIECNSLKNPDAIFRQMGRRVFTDRRHSNFVNSMISAAPNVARKLHVRMTPDAISDFFLRIVREAVDYRGKKNVQRNDFLNILIELNKGKLKFDDKNEEKGLTLEEMTAQAFVFFVAGFETSSSTLTFLLYELALNPDIQKRLREEIQEAVENHGGKVTYECVNSMSYMKQVVSETLRKYPVLPHLQRKTMADYVVPGHPNYVIEKDTTVFIPVMAMHHDPEIYPDPEKFDPERFAPDEMKSRDPIYWLPFGDGPRNCIGLRFGQMQIRVALTYLLSNFEFSPCPKTEIPLVFDPKEFLTSTKGGIHLKVQSI
ncbi:cytochrome P450 6a8-like isoform X9 [Bactrocera dorsalis]|uniref:Cytochrome P450 6a8-like isoform X8 n=1 Tax=Bactrocera dorsalis TaxID=27457 RepID=A0ABM3JDZ7_BACDO|nr:cytochrome P450 6a8-like isoform X8 [Bactrocera dorsalis]XP_049307456.1 cytochrome P450 6a8-like isoform X9 [Bactrocera dorsalis]